MLTIEIHIDDLEEKNISPRASKSREGTKEKRSKSDPVFSIVITKIKSWFLNGKMNK